MTGHPDITDLGLNESEREALVASVMQQVRDIEEARESLLAAVLEWTRPAVTLAAAAALAGITLLSLDGGGPVPEMRPMAAAGSDSFESWVQTGERPSTVEVLAQLTGGAGEGIE